MAAMRVIDEHELDEAEVAAVDLVTGDGDGEEAAQWESGKEREIGSIIGGEEEEEAMEIRCSDNNIKIEGNSREVLACNNAVEEEYLGAPADGETNLENGATQKVKSGKSGLEKSEMPTLSAKCRKLNATVYKEALSFIEEEVQRRQSCGYSV
jgi:hypothetical protein